MLLTRGRDGRERVVHGAQRAMQEFVAYTEACFYFGSIVPEAEPTLPDRMGSQLFIDAPTAHRVPDLSKRCRSGRALAGIAAMVCMDYLLEIGDRHEDNWLLSADNRVWAIDNEIGSEPGQELFTAMRPISRIGLLDDPEWTPSLISRMRRILLAAERGGLCRSRCQRGLRFLQLWRGSLLCPQG